MIKHCVQRDYNNFTALIKAIRFRNCLTAWFTYSMWVGGVV